MRTIKRFEDIEAWRLIRLVWEKIFELTTHGKFHTDYRLKDQIRRSSGSTIDNIAEEFERDGTKEFILFLFYVKGSAGEVRS
jgi:four helix bundle protein